MCNPVVVDCDLRRAQGSNLINAQNNFSFINEGHAAGQQQQQSIDAFCVLLLYNQ